MKLDRAHYEYDYTQKGQFIITTDGIYSNKKRLFNTVYVRKGNIGLTNGYYIDVKINDNQFISHSILAYCKKKPTRLKKVIDDVYRTIKSIDNKTRKDDVDTYIKYAFACIG